MAIPHINKSLKTFAILGYVAWVIAAGMINLIEYPWGYLMRPWFQYNMVAKSSSLHRELTAQIVLATGERIPIPFEDVFPFSSFLIERGHGFSISSVIIGMRQPSRPRALKQLCLYVLEWSYRHIPEYASQAASAEINLRTWPLDAGERSAKSRLWTTCSLDDRK